MTDFICKVKNYYHTIYYNIKLYYFYLQNDNKPKSLLSSIMDSILVRLIVFGIAYFWFIIRTNSVLLSLLLSLIITIMLSYGFYLLSKKPYALKKDDKRKKIADEYIIDKLNKLNSDEFKWHLLKLFMKMPNIGSIKDAKDILLTKLNGDDIAIGFHNDPINSEVSTDMLTRFIHRFRIEGINKAIYITTGSFAKECKELVSKKTYIKLYMLGMDDLLKLMRKTGVVIEEDIVDKIIYNRIMNKKSINKSLFNEIFKQKRFKKYIIYSLIFFIISSVIHIYSVYYNVLGIIFLIMAVSTYIINIKMPVSEGKMSSIIDELTNTDRE